MPRQVRLEPEGARYRVMVRENRHCWIFDSPDQAEEALSGYPRACAGGTQAPGTGAVPADHVGRKKQKAPGT